MIVFVDVKVVDGWCVVVIVVGYGFVDCVCDVFFDWGVVVCVVELFEDVLDIGVVMFVIGLVEVGF